MCPRENEPHFLLVCRTKDGQIIHIVKQVPMIGRMKNDGYMLCTVGKFGQKGKKSYQVHRFVWECYNGFIPDGKVIDYISEIKDDTRQQMLHTELVGSEHHHKST